MTTRSLIKQVWVFILCAGSFFGALLLQYGFNLQPCYLCIAERSIFLLLMILTGVLLVILNSKQQENAVTYGIRVVQLCISLYLGYLLTHHIGIDNMWWVSTCEADPVFFMSQYVPHIFDVKAVCGQTESLHTLLSLPVIGLVINAVLLVFLVSDIRSGHRNNVIN